MFFVKEAAKYTHAQTSYTRAFIHTRMKTGTHASTQAGVCMPALQRHKYKSTYIYIHVSVLAHRDVSRHVHTPTCMCTKTVICADISQLSAYVLAHVRVCAWETLVQKLAPPNSTSSYLRRICELLEAWAAWSVSSQVRPGSVTFTPSSFRQVLKEF